MGDTKSGKSTLVHSLTKESSSFSSSFSLSFSSSHSPEPQIMDDTRGLKVKHFESKTYGHVAFYDFSGQDSFRSTHGRILRQSYNPQQSVVLVVLDLSKLSQEISSSLHRWSSFLRDSLGESQEVPVKVIVVAITLTSSRIMASPVVMLSSLSPLKAWGLLWM